MRRGPQQDLAFGERFGHQAELELLEIPKAPVDELAARRAGSRAEIIALHQQHLQPASGGVARDARAVDPAADYQEVIAFHE